MYIGDGSKSAHAVVTRRVTDPGTLRIEEVGAGVGLDTVANTDVFADDSLLEYCAVKSSRN